MSTELEKKEEKSELGVLDALLSKVVSRKLMVWATATIGLFMEVIPADQWIAVALAYIGSQGAVDLAVAWKKAGKE